MSKRQHTNPISKRELNIRKEVSYIRDYFKPEKPFYINGINVAFPNKILNYRNVTEKFGNLDREVLKRLNLC